MASQGTTNGPAEGRLATLYPRLFPSIIQGNGRRALPFPFDTTVAGTVNPSVTNGGPNRSDPGTPSIPFASGHPVISTPEVPRSTSFNVFRQTLERSNVPKDSESPDSSSGAVGPVNTQTMPTGSLLDLLNVVHDIQNTGANNNQGEVPSSRDDKNVKHIPSYKGDQFNSDVMPPEKFFKWLSSKDPVENYIEVKQQSVTVPNDSASSSSLIVVIVTVCGTVSLCVIGIIVAICYRSRMYSDKEDSISHHETPVRFHASSKQEEFTAPTEYPNIFMGIPANNEIWRDLQNLPETTSVIIPDTKQA